MAYMGMSLDGNDLAQKQVLITTCNILISEHHTYLFVSRKHEWLGPDYEKWSRISYDERNDKKIVSQAEK